MELIVVWLIAISTPKAPDYLFLSKFYNSEKECLEVVSQVKYEAPIKIECLKSGVMAPKKPIES
jgi:hypothetical protein